MGIPQFIAGLLAAMYIQIELSDRMQVGAVSLVGFFIQVIILVLMASYAEPSWIPKLILFGAVGIAVVLWLHWLAGDWTVVVC